MKITAVIMAGGRGERFWPKSRNATPKQFLSLTKDGETMIQKTVKRLRPIVEAEDIFIVTNAAYTELVLDQLPDIPKENILAEPCARNTAPCIAFAAAVIGRMTEDRDKLLMIRDEKRYLDRPQADALWKVFETFKGGK
jgi:mannose-1-phosphate guanylyltransferase